MAPASSDIRRRLKAARELAGLTVTGLAERINSERLGAKALGSLERGERKTPPQPHELAAIAKACNLPPSFFIVDFSRLDEIAPLSSEAERVDDEWRETLARTHHVEVDDLAPLVQRLRELEQRFAELQSDFTTTLVDATRRTKQALAEGLLAEPGGETATAGDTRDEGSATPVAPPTRAQGTRGT